VLGILRLAQVGAPLWGSAAAAVSAFSDIGAALLWGFGIWWLAAAILLLAGYLRVGRLPYSVGWWAFTFPLGAYAAATLALARAWQSGILEDFAVALFVLLAVFWVVVSLGTLRAIRSGAAWAR
jgi:tellurite resistance protein TehA-like permease